MPLPRQAQGRPGTVVIPAGWGAAHAGVVEKALATASQVQIGAIGSAPAWNDDRGQTETTGPEPVYAGPAELMVVTDTTRALTVVEDPVKQRVYEVTLTHGATAEIAVGMGVTVDPDDTDPALAGKTLTVAAIERGTRRFSRVLLATLTD